jgi:hypothetical protein
MVRKLFLFGSFRRNALASQLALIALCCSQAAFAGPCEKSLVASVAAGPRGYSERAGGLRCEGMYVSPVSGASVDLVSVTYGPLPDVGGAQPATLQLKIGGQPPLASTVHIRAVGIPQSLYYQMDTTISPNQEAAWPLNEVVRPEGIQLGDIGIFGFQNDDAKTIFLPIVATSPGNAPSDRLFVTLRVDNLLHLKWRFASQNAAVPEYSPAVQTGDRLMIAIPPTSKPPGRLEVRWDEPVTGRARVRAFQIGG